jgi:hypothetical protein
VVFQEYVEGARTVLAVGRSRASLIQFGLTEIFRETFSREDFLLAGETIRHSACEALTFKVIQELGYSGFFSMNWLLKGDTVVLSSCRPVPRAVLGTLRRAGVDLMKMEKNRVASAGTRFIVDIHYSRYHETTESLW